MEAVGTGVTRFGPGEEVFGTCTGALAEYVGTPEDKLERKPSNLTVEQAAAVPTSGLAALHGIRDAGKVQPGQKVPINGASGGVGTFAVQIAKALGAEVTGVCSTRNVELVGALSADHVIDYTQEDFTQGGPRYDLILDNAGNHSLSALRRALAPTGRLSPTAVRPGSAPYHGLRLVSVPPTTGAPVPLGAEAEGLDVPEGAPRGREGHTGHRPDLSAERRC